MLRRTNPENLTTWSGWPEIRRLSLACGVLFAESDMKIPVITGLIRRRILVNYRVAQTVVEALLPSNFRPKLVNGWSIAGICLIRLEEMRPEMLPKLAGVSSENCAHRIAVEWDDPGGAKEGVFIPRRDTSSRFNAWAGGRIFPGVHHHSSFTVNDCEGRISLKVTSHDQGEALVELDAFETMEFPRDSTFSSLEESSSFFEAGCTGYSSRLNSSQLDGLFLKAGKWEVSPLEVHSLRSAFYDAPSIFPKGSIEFDHALLMRDIPHEWHSKPEMTWQRSSGSVI